MNTAEGTYTLHTASQYTEYTSFKDTEIIALLYHDNNFDTLLTPTYIFKEVRGQKTELYLEINFSFYMVSDKS